MKINGASKGAAFCTLYVVTWHSSAVIFHMYSFILYSL